MARLQLRNLRICVWLFSIVVLIVPLLIGTGLTLQLDSDDFQDRIIATVSTQLSASPGEEVDSAPVQSLLKKLQAPLLAILLFCLTGSILALILFYRYLIRPIDAMTSTAHRIIDGDLELSMPESRCREVNDLGRAFNDLSINLQEVILLVWNYLKDSSGKLDQILQSDHLDGKEKFPAPMRQDLMAMRGEMKTIEKVITSFKLYDVQIIDERAMAGSNTWQEGCEQGRVKTADKEGASRKP